VLKEQLNVLCFEKSLKIAYVRLVISLFLFFATKALRHKVF
jgi:hypothetical protein